MLVTLTDFIGWVEVLALIFFRRIETLTLQTAGM